jgi:hypothetical protein
MGKMKKRRKSTAKMGRKPLHPAAKMVLVGFYTRQHNVNRLGGMPNARQKAKEMLEGWLADPSVVLPTDTVTV